VAKGIVAPSHGDNGLLEKAAAHLKAGLELAEHPQVWQSLAGTHEPVSARSEQRFIAVSIT
jgi:hypothetical protein